ncbi:hypothetical protein ACI65C_013846 [Semiaphis heraclei]
MEGINSYCPATLPDHYNNGLLIPGQWRRDLSSNALQLTQTGSNTHSRNAKEVREKLMNYYTGVGAIPFQYDVLGTY